MTVTERQQQVLTLWEEGHSSGNIGNALGMTRGAVMGIVHRMKRKGLAQPRISATLILKKLNVPLPAREPIVVRKPKKVFDQEPQPLVLCEINGCKFAVDWDHKEKRHLFCNKTSVPNKSFCSQHYDVVYEKKK
jgi:GcrA cell cycle regulator